MAGKKWWIWLLAILTAAGVLVVLLMQQNMPEKQKGLDKIKSHIR